MISFTSMYLCLSTGFIVEYWLEAMSRLPHYNVPRDGQLSIRNLFTILISSYPARRTSLTTISASGTT